MSVINSVLKDLETRESSFVPIEFPALENRVERRPAWKPWMLFLLAVISVSAAAWYYRQYGLPFDPAQWWQGITRSSVASVARSASENTRSEVIEAAGVSLSPPLLAAETKAPPPEPAVVAGEPIDAVESGTDASGELPPANQIIGLQMHEADTEMHLEFALRDKVVAYMTERSGNGFAYHLRDIQSQIAAPLLRDNRWLQSLSITSAGDGVDIRFETVAGILVETRQQQGQDERIWRISFRQPGPVIAAEPVIRQAPAVVVPVQPVIETPVPAKSPAAGSEAVAAPLAVAQNEAGTAEAKPAVEAASFDEASEVKLDIRATSLNATDINRLKYALELINSGRYADAERLLQSLLNSSEDYAARTHLLALYGHHERHDRLARLAQNSLARYPGDSVFLTEYARSRYQAKAYRVALELLSGIPRFNADQHALAAACHQRLGNHERAVEHYREALTLNAGNARNWVGLGISQEHTGELEKALQSYRNAMKLGTLNDRLLTFAEKRSETLAQVLK